jgi:hypothetical protein
MTNAKAKSGLGKERIPTPLFTDQYLCGEFTLALLNDQLARGKVGGDPLTCVSRCKFGAIGIERSLREGPPSKLPSQPTTTDIIYGVLPAVCLRAISLMSPAMIT